MKILSKYKSLFNLEAFVWIFGLIFLYFIKVDNSSHFTFCPFKNLGINFCPGCGLGKSIHYFLHLQLTNSLQTHPLGIFAFFILLNRIISIFKEDVLEKKFHNLKGINYE